LSSYFSFSAFDLVLSAFQHVSFSAFALLISAFEFVLSAFQPFSFSVFQRLDCRAFQR